MTPFPPERIEELRYAYARQGKPTCKEGLEMLTEIERLQVRLKAAEKLADAVSATAMRRTGNVWLGATTGCPGRLSGGPMKLEDVALQIAKTLSAGEWGEPEEGRAALEALPFLKTLHRETLEEAAKAIRGDVKIKAEPGCSPTVAAMSKIELELLDAAARRIRTLMEEGE